ncbi:MAG: anti-sigma factor family protein [Acidimicrobiales bacterium]
MFGRHRSLVCRQAVELLTDYLEGALSRRDTARLEAHLAACEHCSTYLDQLRRTIDTLGQVEPETLTPEVQDELVRLYQRWREG